MEEFNLLGVVPFPYSHGQCRIQVGGGIPHMNNRDLVVNWPLGVRARVISMYPWIGR